MQNIITVAIYVYFCNSILPLQLFFLLFLKFDWIFPLFRYDRLPNKQKWAFSTPASLHFQPKCYQSCSRHLCHVQRRYNYRKNFTGMVFILQERGFQPHRVSQFWLTCSVQWGPNECSYPQGSAPIHKRISPVNGMLSWYKQLWPYLVGKV